MVLNSIIRETVMKKTGKIINLCLFMLLMIFPLCADPLPDDETLLPGNEPLLEEEAPPDDGSFVFEAPPIILEVPAFETRSFNDIFPGLTRSQKSFAMSGTGIRNFFGKDEPPMLIPSPASKIDLLGRVMSKKPSHIVEALIVLPYNKRELDLLDIYNALRNIYNIQDYTVSMGGEDVHIFTETTRLESAKNRKPIPDPPHTNKLPLSETMYLRFVDKFMGALYLRGDISINVYGITYSLTNFRDVTYGIFSIMKAEKFIAIIYLEPIKEGMLIYSMAGLYIPNFIAQRENIPPNMNIRIAILVKWITDGLRREE